MLENLRRGLARLIWPRSAPGKRMYASARPSRLAGAGSANSSADQELVTSLTSLRTRSRQLVRDASYANRAKVVVVNNVIGTGIGMQAQVKTTRGEMNEAVNDAIETSFEDWSCAEYCHTGGVMHFNDLERAMMAQIFEAGEVFIRKHYTPFGRSPIPFCLELIEAERLADDIKPPGPKAPGAEVRMGVEVDKFYRPIAYWFRERHLGELRIGVLRSDNYERVPADQVWHLRIADRWPQTRGEPWLHTVIRRLQDMDGYSEAEIVAARGAASYMAWIESPDDPQTPLGGKVTEDGSIEMTLEPGMIKRGAPGEKLTFHAPNRPNTAMDPFMRYMLREVAAGTGPSYESLSRDYSQSNYSSSRLALLDDRDLWRFFQSWFIRSFRAPLHKEWLQAAVLSQSIGQIGIEAYAVDTPRYELVKFKPRGWSWIDPAVEVEAAIKAVRAGFTDVGDVIAKTGEGRDLWDVLEAREQELKWMKEKGLEFDTDPNRLADGAPQEPPKPVTVQGAAPAGEKKPPQEEANAEAGRTERAVSAALAGAAEVVRSQKAPQAIVNLPAINVEQPTVNVKAGDINISPQTITINPGDVLVDVKPANAPDVRVESPTVNVSSPQVNVAAPEVRIDNHVEPTPITVAAPNVNVEAAQVNVENRVEVPAPTVNVEAPQVRVDVAAPTVKVNVEQPSTTITEHERDPETKEVIRSITKRK